MTAMRAVPDVAVLLWDLDNVDPGRRWTSCLASAFKDAAGPGAWLIVSGRSTVTGPRRHVLHDLGFTVIRGGLRRNGADRKLLGEGGRLTRRRASRVIVASGDRAFARLAALGDMTVFVLQPECLSRDLAACANRVVVFERIETAFVPGKPTIHTY